MAREYAASITRHEPIVYYVTSTHGGIVKIGTTMDVRLRWARIRRAQPALEPILLAYEWGREDVERDRHWQFSHNRHRGEWFWMADDLRQWIDELAADDEPDVLAALQLAAKPAMYGRPHDLAEALAAADIHRPLLEQRIEGLRPPQLTVHRRTDV